MRRKLLLSLVSACASWFMQPVLAQSRMSTPSTLPGATTSGQTVPGQTPGATGPLGQNTPDAMSAKIDDKKFAKDAALGGMAEVQLGKLSVGDHKIHFMNGDGTYMEKHLTIEN